MASDRTAKEMVERARKIAEHYRTQLPRTAQALDEAATLISSQAEEIGKARAIYDEQVTRAERQWQAWEARALTAEAALAKAVEDEREACAQLVSAMETEGWSKTKWQDWQLLGPVAAAIRSRATTEKDAPDA